MRSRFDGGTGKTRRCPDGALRRPRMITTFRRPSVHRFATRVFTIAGIYGLIVLIPQYFTESRFATDFPPALTHAEYFYGFLGVTVAWQICFLVIARDPVRMRPVMIP